LTPFTEPDRLTLIGPCKQVKPTYPAADDLDLRIDLGVCRLEARPSEAGNWVAGTCHHPTGKRAPTIRQEGRVVTITEKKPFLEHIPAVFEGVPHYELRFGKDKKRPFALTIETGASEFDLDLGGVPLKALTVRQGPGRFNLDFSAPNPQHMSLLEVSSGAAGMELENLANANFSKMRFYGGAASYELDFAGRLSRDAEVVIEAGLSGVEIAVPSSTAAKIVAETTVGSVDMGDGFTKREGAFLTEAAVAGKKPLLTIRAGVRIGALQIRESELSGEQQQLLRAFDVLAGGSPTPDVTASAAAQEAGFDPGSREFEAALEYLVDVGYLVRTGDEGEEAFRITVEGINEVQRRPQL
jgi:hypothetical protein